MRAMEPSPRYAARAAGLTRYHGRPCPRGHTERRVSDKHCVACRRASEKRREAAKRASRPERPPSAPVTFVSDRPCKLGHTERYVLGRNCVLCAKAARADYYAANREKLIAAARRYNAERREQINADRRAGPKRKRKAKESKRTPARRQKERRKRARRKGAQGRHTHAEVVGLLKLQKGKCAYCKASLKGGYDEDHITPLALGGSDRISNIQLLCKPCNNRKGAKHPTVYAQSLGLLI
jgi:5-methylcytosine-specific restriction endonuclease McrA